MNLYSHYGLLLLCGGSTGVFDYEGSRVIHSIEHIAMLSTGRDVAVPV